MPTEASEVNEWLVACLFGPVAKDDILSGPKRSP